MRTPLAPVLLLGALLSVTACHSTSSSSGSAAGASGSAQAPGRIELSSDHEASAQVVAVDKTAREATLRRQDGALVGVQAGEGVRNFEQVAVGDHLKVRYRQSLTAERNPADAAAQPQVGLAAGRAPAGEKPGAGVAVGVRFTVKIESLDLAHDIVVGSLDSGELIAHRLSTPEGKAFARGLKLGDRVQLTYHEALALAIEKM